MGNGGSKTKAYKAWLKKNEEKSKPKTYTEEVTFIITGKKEGNDDKINYNRATKIQFRKTKEGEEEVTFSIVDECVGSQHQRDFREVITLDSKRITRIGYFPGYNKERGLGYPGVEDELGLGFEIEYTAKDEYNNQKPYFWKSECSKDRRENWHQCARFKTILPELTKESRFPCLKDKLIPKEYPDINAGASSTESDVEPAEKLTVLERIKQMATKNGNQANGAMADLMKSTAPPPPKEATDKRRLAASNSMENVFTMMWILPLLVIFVFWFKRYIVTKNNDDIVEDNVNKGENDPRITLSNMV